MHWTAYLENLQIVFSKFDVNAVISKPVLIGLFCNGLQPSIYIQGKQNSRQKDIWKQVIKKVITAEAKTAFNLPSGIWRIDICCLQSHWSSPKIDKGSKDKIFNRNFSMF